MLTRTFIFFSSLMLFAGFGLKAEQSEFIKRAVVTSAIENREPVDQLAHIDMAIDTVYFFTEVVNKADSFVTHRWRLDGKLQAEVVLKIGSNRWRTYSSKNLVPALHTGQWQVEVLDQQNNLLATRTFSY